MWEINVEELETNSQEFPIAKEAILRRYERLHRLHVPSGQLTFRGEPPQRERVASSYTLIAVEHADVAMRAFGDALYSPGFTLARPTMEAVVKQFLLDDYEGDDGGWQSIPKKQVRVTQSSLRELAKRHPELVDIAPLWTKLSPVFNDFVHGGMGQLTSNPIDRYSEPQYPGNWFAWAARLYTVLMLVSSGRFWAHLGDQEHCQAVLRAVTEEDWRVIAITRNGQNVRINT